VRREREGEGEGGRVGARVPPCACAYGGLGFFLLACAWVVGGYGRLFLASPPLLSVLPARAHRRFRFLSTFFIGFCTEISRAGGCFALLSVGRGGVASLLRRQGMIGPAGALLAGGVRGFSFLPSCWRG
jgi:hypothetical protein